MQLCEHGNCTYIICKAIKHRTSRVCRQYTNNVNTARTEKYREAIKQDVEDKISALTSARDSLRDIMDEMKA